MTLRGGWQTVSRIVDLVRWMSLDLPLDKVRNGCAQRHRALQHCPALGYSAQDSLVKSNPVLVGGRKRLSHLVQMPGGSESV